VAIDLPRGTVLGDGDLLRAPATDRWLRLTARPEPVMTVRAATAHDMVRGAFHLGNRHVALELGPDYLRLAPDPVLAGMVVGLGLTIVEEVAPFYPEPGAYGAGHGHSHGHSH
jgi:urease accessory protein